MAQDTRCFGFCEKDCGEIKGADVGWDVGGFVPECSETRELVLGYGIVEVEGLEQVESRASIKDARYVGACSQRFPVGRELVDDFLREFQWKSQSRFYRLTHHVKELTGIQVRMSIDKLVRRITYPSVSQNANTT